MTSRATVDRTKPSTACEPCRRRRAKCDRRRPQCSQCIRSSTVCTGYREDLDLVMRDQNEKVLRQMQKRMGSSSSTKSSKSQPTVPPQVSDESAVSSTTGSPADTVNAPKTVTTTSIPQSVYETAVHVFVTNFANGMHLDWLPHLINSPTRSVMFEASLEAVAALYLSYRDPKVNASKTAVPRYSVALQEISKALSDASRASRDDSIASVMLLALYAAWSSPAIETAESWIYHINGAMTLLEMRPDDTFDGQVVQSLLVHVIGSVHLDCLSRKTSLPPQLRRLCNLSKLSADAFTSRYWELVAGVIGAREAISSDHGISDDVFDHVRRLEAETSILTNTMPTNWTDAMCDPIFPDPDHEYSNYRAVQTRNTLQVIRIELNQLVLAYSHNMVRSNYGNISLINTASDALEKSVEQICESVPRFLRTANDGIPVRHDSNMWICSLVWPCAQAMAVHHMLPPIWTERLGNQFRVFADSSGMPHIRDAASQIIGGPTVPDGLHVFSLC